MRMTFPATGHCCYSPVNKLALGNNGLWISAGCGGGDVTARIIAEVPAIASGLKRSSQVEDLAGGKTGSKFSIHLLTIMYLLVEKTRPLNSSSGKTTKRGADASRYRL